MTYLVTDFWSDGTEEQYQAVEGPTDGGYLISVVWDSKDHNEQFVNGTLRPELPVVGDSPVHPRSV